MTTSFKFAAGLALHLVKHYSAKVEQVLSTIVDVIGSLIAHVIFITLGLVALAAVIYGAIAAGPVVVLLIIIVLLLLPRN